MTRVWLLNLDAEREMARPLGYGTSQAIASKMRALRCVLKDTLCVPGDLVLDEDDVSELDRGACEVRLWCPTPTAIQRVRSEAWLVAEHPSFDIICRVNHRRFCAELGQPLVDGAFLSDKNRIVEHVGAPTETGWWLLKRPFGFSGKGRRRVRCDSVEVSDHDWIDASIRHGEGLQVEPWLERKGDYALHGWVEKGARVHLGRVCQQECDQHGAWKRTTLLSDDAIPSQTRQRLMQAGRETAEALGAEGYFGPFGIDGYEYVRAGEQHLNPRCEINARFTTGWRVGMGDFELP